MANVLNSALPPQRHRPDTRPEHQDPVSHMAGKGLEQMKMQQVLYRTVNSAGLVSQSSLPSKADIKNDCDSHINLRNNYHWVLSLHLVFEMSVAGKGSI